MNLEEISSLWEEDVRIDDTNLDAEALKIPTLHSRYTKILFTEKKIFHSLNFKAKQLKHDLTSYYKGDLNGTDRLQEIDREPCLQAVSTKEAIQQKIDADPEMMKLMVKVVYQEEKINLLQEILRSINGRSFIIKDAIEWRKLTNFGMD